MRLTPQQAKAALSGELSHTDGLSFAVLVGSRANGHVHEESDWDLAIQWAHHVTPLQRLEKTELLRQALSHAAQVSSEKIDLIDLANARLTMRALVAEEGQPLHLTDDLAWIRFLQNTWAEIEDNDWRRTHAA